MEHDKAEILSWVFPDLGEEHLAELVSAAELHTYPPDTILCREGQVEDTFYIIVDGRAEITKRFDGDTQRVLQRPGPGEFFGEIGLVQECPRTATVRAIETTTLLEVGCDTFMSVLKRSAPMAMRVMLQVTSRLRDADRDAIADLHRNNVELARAYAELEQALREARSESSKNQVILESMADGIIVFDLGGKVVVINNTIAHFMGQPASQIIGRDIETLLSDVEVQTRETLLGFLASSERHSIKFQWRDRVLSASIAPVRLASGEGIGTVAVLRDITREVEVERARESLFAVAAHEMRTPLNAIINFANMLRAGVLPPEKQENAIGRIAVNGERLLILVNNLLERAKMEAGQVRLKLDQFDPVELIENVRDVMEVLAQEKGLTLSADIAGDLPAPLLGDQQRLHQILVNLVGNGIKFTDEGGVRIRASLPDANHWALEVSDTGSGIPAEARNRIFEPFELAEDPATRKHAGAGLGLSIVKQLVSMMGGEVGLESEVGKGSTFTVVLPLVLNANESPADNTVKTGKGSK